MFSSMEWMLLVLHRNMAFVFVTSSWIYRDFQPCHNLQYIQETKLLSTFILAEIFLQHLRRKVHLQRKIFGSGISANFRKNSKRPQRDTQGLRENWFMKKTWSRQSRGTVPFIYLLNVYHQSLFTRSVILLRVDSFNWLLDLCTFCFE